MESEMGLWNFYTAGFHCSGVFHRCCHKQIDKTDIKRYIPAALHKNTATTDTEMICSSEASPTVLCTVIQYHKCSPAERKCKSATKDRSGWTRKDDNTRQLTREQQTFRTVREDAATSNSDQPPKHPQWRAENPAMCPCRAAPTSLLPWVSGEGKAVREWQGGRVGQEMDGRRCKGRALTNQVATLR